MAEIQDLSATDANNIARWPENMPFSGVNDAGRADEGILARWYKDTNASITASGSANAFAITSNRVIAALFDGLLMAFTANFSITGATTINLNGLGAKSLKRFNGTTLASGDIISGQPILALYKASGDQWFMLSAPAAINVPALSIDVSEQVTPPVAPSADTARIFAADNGAGGTVLMWKDSADFVSYLRRAVQADMETRSQINYVSPDVQHHHPSHPKAWGAINSGGTIAASDGVASAVRNSTGHYTITLTTALASTAYAVIGSVVGTGSPLTFGYQITSTTVFTVEVTVGGSFSDRAFSFTVFGDLP